MTKAINAIAPKTIIETMANRRGAPKNNPIVNNTQNSPSRIIIIELLAGILYLCLLGRKS